MAKINVKATVTAPAEINIPLVRADHYATSNVFRVFFEVFLSMTSAVVGTMLSASTVTSTHWVMLVVFCISMLSFLGCSIYFGRASRTT